MLNVMGAVLDSAGGQLQESAGKLRKEDREVGRGRKWRQNYRLLNQEVLLLEEEEKKLELVYPQVAISMLWRHYHMLWRHLHVLVPSPCFGAITVLFGVICMFWHHLHVWLPSMLLCAWAAWRNQLSPASDPVLLALHHIGTRWHATALSAVLVIVYLIVWYSTVQVCTPHSGELCSLNTKFSCQVVTYNCVGNYCIFSGLNMWAVKPMWHC